MADYNVTDDAGSMSIMLESEQVERALGDLKGKTPAALKVAVNRTARQARAMMLDDVKERYDLNAAGRRLIQDRSEEHTSELQSRFDLVCRLLLEKKKKEAISKS